MTSNWNLVTKFSLSGAAIDEEVATRLTDETHSQALLDLDISPECLRRVIGTITETIRKVRNPLNHHGPELPIHISLFCSEKMVNSPICPDNQMNGGWGYYMIERSHFMPGHSDQDNFRVIELYLYKEG